MQREGGPLENELQSELNLPRRADDRSDLSGCVIRRASGVQEERSSRQTQIRVIQNIEELRSKLSIDPFRDLSVLGQ